MTFESAKLLAASTSAVEWYKSCARSCLKLFKFLCGPTQRERGIVLEKKSIFNKWHHISTLHGSHSPERTLVLTIQREPWFSRSRENPGSHGPERTLVLTVQREPWFSRSRENPGSHSPERTLVPTVQREPWFSQSRENPGQ